MASRRAHGLALALAACTAEAAVPPGLSGSWYNPAQAGHGISLQVRDDGRATAYWFVYDAAGNPLHLYVDAVADGRALHGTAYAGRGMRFGAFDPADHVLTAWGRVSIEFADCSHATLRYDGALGAGSLAIERLSTLAGTTCDDAALHPIAVGLYAGEVTRQAGGHRYVLPLDAAVDPDGRLWAVPSNQLVGPMYVGPYGPLAIVSDGATSVVDGRAVADSRFAFAAGWYKPEAPGAVFALHDRRIAQRFAARFDDGAAGVGTGLPPTIVDARFTRRDGLAEAQLAGALTPAMLAGRYETVASGQLVSTVLELTIDADGRACARIEGAGGPCRLEGRVAIRSSEWRFFDFELASPNGARYRGRGWAEGGRGADATRVVFAGDNGADIALAFAAVRS